MKLFSDETPRETRTTRAPGRGAAALPGSAACGPRRRERGLTAVRVDSSQEPTPNTGTRTSCGLSSGDPPLSDNRAQATEAASHEEVTGQPIHSLSGFPGAQGTNQSQGPRQPGLGPPEQPPRGRTVLLPHPCPCPAPAGSGPKPQSRVSIPPGLQLSLELTVVPGQQVGVRNQ